VISHDVRVPPGDVVAIAGVQITRPDRTLVDLARSTDADDIAAACSWGAASPSLVTSARAWIARHPRFPYARRADDVLASVGIT
jgi:hypothetical protein